MKNILAFIFTYCTLSIYAQNWTPIGPQGGYFKDFAVHPTNSQIIIAGSDDSGGLWKTTDGGQTWTLITGMLPNFTGWKVVFDPIDPDIIYACDLYSRYGIIKSTDGGLTWQVINNGLNTKYDRMVTGLVIAYGTQDTLLICTGYEQSGTPPRPGNGIFKSVNGGLSWFPSGLQGTSTPCIASNGAGGALFAGTRGAGLKISTDLGATWFNHPQIPNTADINEIESDSNVVMVSAGALGVYLSTDYGNSFTNIGMVGEFNFEIDILRLSPVVELFSSTFTGLKKYSSSTGQWTAVNHPDLNNHLAMAITSVNDTVYLSNFTNGNILKSFDGGSTWSTLSQSPIATEIGGMYIDPTNTNHIIVSLLGTYNILGLPGLQSISESTDGGVTWTRKGPVGHGGVLVKEPGNNNTFYVGLFGQGLYKTTDGFTTSTNIRSGNKVILDVAVNPSNTQEVLISELDLTTSTYAILKSTNGGNSFINTAAHITTKLVYDPNNPSIVYAAATTGLYKSTDGGSTWILHLFSGLPISTVEVTPTQLYASLYNGVLYKINGTQFTNITGTWPANSQITNIVTYNNSLVIGINGAEKDTTMNMIGSVYMSNDSGTTWTDITGDMTCTHIYGNTSLQAMNGQLYAATYGGGVYNSSGILNHVNTSVSQNQSVSIYPNPAQNHLTIEFSTDIENAEVRIYNQTGQIVLRQAAQNGGVMYLSTEGLPDGTYLLMVLNGEIRTTRRLVLSR